MEKVIEISNVKKIYEMGEQLVKALNGVSLDINKNEYVLRCVTNMKRVMELALQKVLIVLHVFDDFEIEISKMFIFRAKCDKMMRDAHSIIKNVDMSVDV